MAGEKKKGKHFDNFGGQRKNGVGAGDEDEHDATSLGLSDLVRGMQHVVNGAAELLAQHYTQQLERYFAEDGNPYLKRIKFPDGSTVMDVPLVALVPPSGLGLEKMSMRLSVRVDQTKVKRKQVEGSQTPHDRASLRVSLGSQEGDGRKGSMIDIEMEFKAGEPPEAAQRIIEELTKQMVPIQGDHDEEPAELPPTSSSSASAEGGDNA
jgi:hypothetical protein